MTIEAQLADGRVLEFPDGTDPSVIQATVKRMLAPAPAKDAGFSLKDIGVAFGQGAVGSGQALTNVAGAGNAASQYLGDVTESLGKQYTPERQAEMQRQQQRMKKAEESGSTWEEIKAGAQNVYEAPLQSAAQGLGSFLPYIPAMFAGPAAAALGLGSRAVAAANVVAKAYAPIVGTAQGAGAVKGAIYSAVYKAEKESGLSEAEARQNADVAQNYYGKNLDQIALGSALGYVASKGGIEKFLTKEGREKAAEKLIPRVTKAVTEESVTEGGQGGQERLASNIALQRTGRDVPTFQGVGGQAAQEALTAALTAGAVSIPQSSKAPVEDLTKRASTTAGQEALDIVNPTAPPPPAPERVKDVEPVINPPVGDSVPVVSEREIVQPPAGTIAPEGVGVGAVVPPIVPAATGEGEQPAALKPSLGDYNIGLPDELSDTFARLQNRDRASQESIIQMKKISNEADYDRLSVDPNFGSGAPVVISDFKLPTNQLGTTDITTAVDGRKIPIQYAVVSANDLLPSHTSDGQINKSYADSNTPAIRPIAGNGRVAGLQEGYGKSSPSLANYASKMVADPRHGIDPNVIKATPNPVLIRIMPKTEITRNIGDVSNVSAGLELSPLEKAKNDANRLDLNNIEFEETKDGALNLSKKSAAQFIQGMPETERNTLINLKTGEPNTTSIDRLRNAIFLKTYNSDTLGELYTESFDPEAKLILAAMQIAAPKMATLNGRGIYDIRNNVVQAAELAVNARKNGVSLKEIASQIDITSDPTTSAILKMFADNSRSGKRMGSLLNQFANAAYEQNVEDMFGDQPQMPLSEVVKALKPDEQVSEEEEVKLAPPEEKKAEEGTPPKLVESGVNPRADRHPQVQAAAKLLKEGKITREEFAKYSDYYGKPVVEISKDELNPPTTNEKMLETVNSNKVDKINVPIADGTLVGLRMDLPALKRGGAVVSIHKGKPGLKNPGNVISFQSVGHLIGGKKGRVTFEPRSQEKGLDVAIGGKGKEGDKEPLQTVEGIWKNIAPEAAFAKVKELMGTSGWTQVSLNPARHGYFYDRKTGEPVKSASEIYQVGNFLLAKDVEFAPKSEFLYSLRGKSEGQITAFEQSLRTLLNKFGLKDVGLKLSEGMRDEGSYAAKLIQIAADSASPIRTLRHEAIHALRELGFFTDAQWNSLSKMAKDKWIDQYLKQRDIDGKPLKAGEESRYDAYMREYKGDMEKITEEAVADAFADFDTKPPAGMIQAILQKLRNLFQSIRSALTKMESAEQIFSKAEKGALKPISERDKKYVTSDEIAKMQMEAWSKLRGEQEYIDLNKKVEAAEKLASNRWHRVNDKAVEILKSKPGFNKIATEFDDKTVRRLAQVFMEEADAQVPISQPTVNQAMKDRQSYAEMYFKDVAKIPEPRKFAESASQQRGYYDSPAFKNWFKKSEVVDVQGNPLVAFHVTSSDFVEFDIEAGAKAAKNTHAAYSGQLGAWFTAPSLYQENYEEGNAELAVEHFIEDLEGNFKGGANTMLVHLSIQNPMEYSDFESMIEDRNSFPSISAYKASLIKEGHDGIVIRNSETDGSVDRDDWVAFNAIQIKSAIGNNGEFSPTNADIRKNLRPSESKSLRDRATANFNRWFGDSKVVDENDKPLVVYHGTASTAPIDVFEKRNGGNEGYWFGESSLASDYATRRGIESAAVYPVYLHIKRPAQDLSKWNASVESKDGKYDGYIGKQPDGRVVYSVLTPNQIKSAIGNNGDYSLTNADIRKNLRSQAGEEKAGTEKGQEALNITGGLGRVSEKPSSSYIKQVREAWDNATDNPKATASEAKSAVVKFIDLIQTKAFSSDAAINNSIRREVNEFVKDNEQAIGTMLNISQSQVVHADALANLFLTSGNLKYNKELYKYEAVEDKSNIVELAKQLGEIKEKYGLTQAQTELIGHTAFEAKRLKSLLQFNNQVDQEVAEMRAEADKLSMDAIQDLVNPLADLSGKEAAANALREKATRRSKDTKFIHMTAAEIAAGNKLFKVIPELNGVVDTWNQMRDNAANLLVDSGLWSKDEAEFLLSNADYVPFFREEQLEKGKGPKEYIRGLMVQAQEKKLKGSNKPVNDIFDNMNRWLQYSVNRAVRNRSALALIDTASDFGQAKRIDKKADGENAVRVWRNGKEEFYDMTDPMFVEAFTGLESITIPAWKWASTVANFLRQSVVLNPLFTLAQVPQDSFAAMFTSGLKPQFALQIPARAVKEFLKTLVNRSATNNELRKYGVVGVRDFTSQMARLDAQVYAGMKTSPGILGKLKSFLEHVAMAGDNAVRQATYEAALEQKLSKAEALEKSFEIWNIRRKGTSQSLAIASQVIPFFGAYLAAQNVMLKTISGVSTSPTERNAAIGALVGTTASVMTLSLLYAMMNGDDEDYLKKPAAIRDRMLMVPGTNGFGIPLRSDLFSIPKIITEHMYLMITDKGYEDGRKFRDSMKNALGNAFFSPTVVPQAVKPGLEVLVNYNFFQGRPIIGEYQKRLETERQFNESTSEIAKVFSKTGLLSPIAADHIFRGMFGSVGGLVIYMTNPLLHSDPNVDKPTMSTKDMLATLPGASSFVSKEKESALKADFYVLRDEVAKVTNTLSDLKERNPEKIAEYIADPDVMAKLTVSKGVQGIDKKLGEIRKAMTKISNLPNSVMDSDEKQQQIKQLREAETTMLKAINVKNLREMAKI